MIFIKNDDITKVLENGNISEKMLIVRYNDNVTKDHLYIAINDNNPWVRAEVIDKIKSKVTKDMMDKYFNMRRKKFLGTKEDWDNICLLYL